MADSGPTARREAALRLPPLADGRHDPDFELPSLHAPGACHVCGGGKPPELVRIFGQLMCRDRVECYQRVRRGR